MTSVVTRIATPTQRARAGLARKVHPNPGIRVEPRDDTMRRLLKHPRAGGFRSEGSIEWPNDTFTRRRLREGSIKLAETGKHDDKHDDKHGDKHEAKPKAPHHHGGD